MRTNATSAGFWFLRALLAGTASMTICSLLGCDDPEIGAPPSGGYSRVKVDYTPKPSADAIRIKIPHCVLNDKLLPIALPIPQEVFGGAEFVFSGSIRHPDTRMKGSFVVARIFDRKADGTLLELNKSTTSAKGTGGELVFEQLILRIPKGSPGRYHVEVLASTIRPGIKSVEEIEDWVIPIAIAECVVN